MAVTATLELKLSALETPALGLDLASDPRIQHTSGADRLTLSATTTPAVTQVWSDQVQLSTGAATIDLASLSRGSVLSALNLTGLKVQAILLEAPSTNSAALVVAVGASNPYDIFGAAGGTVTLPAGAKMLWYAPEGIEDVASGAKEIDLSSSDQDALLNVCLIAG